MNFIGGTQQFNSVDIFLNDLNGLRNWEFVVKKICNFVQQNYSSKFHNTGKLINFVFAEANTLLKMRKEAS